MDWPVPILCASSWRTPLTTGCFHLIVDGSNCEKQAFALHFVTIGIFTARTQKRGVANDGWLWISRYIWSNVAFLYTIYIFNASVLMSCLYLDLADKPQILQTSLRAFNVNTIKSHFIKYVSLLRCKVVKVRLEWWSYGVQRSSLDLTRKNS